MISRLFADLKKKNFNIISALHLDFAVNFLNSRSQRERLIVIGGAAAFVLLLDFFIFLRPVGSMLLESAPKLASLEKELAGLKEDRKNKDAIRLKWQDAGARLGEKEKAFAAPSEVHVLLENLSKQALNSRLKILSIKPLDLPPKSAGYAALPIQISALAGTHEFGAFLERLETGRTFFRVVNLKLMSNPTDEKKHLADLVVETYRKGGS